MFCCWKTAKKIRLEGAEKVDAKKFVVRIDIQDNKAKVIEVYDGDTVTVLFYSNGELCHAKVRLLGIDTPEMKGKTDQEKAKAVLARDALSKLLMNKVVTLSNTGIEKWGRILADVWLDGLYVNDYMVKEGHAVPYGGSYGLTKTHVW